MSEYKNDKEQEKEINAGIAERLQSRVVDGRVSLQQNIDRSRIESRIASASSTPQQNANVAADSANTASGVTTEIQKVLTNCRSLAVQLWENFEDIMDYFVADLADAWTTFNAMSPWEKILVVLGILAIISLIAGVGYFSWEFVCFLWPKIVQFAQEYGPNIAAEGLNFLKAIENSDIYITFTNHMQNNIGSMDLTGWNSLLQLGMPSMLALYKHFFNFLSTMTKS